MGPLPEFPPLGPRVQDESCRSQTASALERRFPGADLAGPLPVSPPLAPDVQDQNCRARTASSPRSRPSALEYRFPELADPLPALLLPLSPRVRVMAPVRPHDPVWGWDALGPAVAEHARLRVLEDAYCRADC